MDQVIGFLAVAGIAAVACWFWRWRRRRTERKRAAEERFASFMAQAMAAAKPPPDPAERLLFEAAAKAGEANEPALAIQLYARLLARFPDGALAAQARAAVEAQKRRLAKA